MEGFRRTRSLRGPSDIDAWVRWTLLLHVVRSGKRNGAAAVPPRLLISPSLLQTIRGWAAG